MIVIKFFVIFIFWLVIVAGIATIIGLMYWSCHKEKEEPLDINIIVSIEEQKVSDTSNASS